MYYSVCEAYCQKDYERNKNERIVTGQNMAGVLKYNKYVAQLKNNRTHYYLNTFNNEVSNYVICKGGSFPTDGQLPQKMCMIKQHLEVLVVSPDEVAAYIICYYAFYGSFS